MQLLIVLMDYPPFLKNLRCKKYEDTSKSLWEMEWKDEFKGQCLA